MLQRAFVAQPQIRTFLSGHEFSQVWSVAFSLDGKTLAPSDGTLFFLMLESESLEASRSGVISLWLRNVTFSPDGQNARPSPAKKR